MRGLYKGDRVMVFEDPITRQKPEGEARLINFISKVDGEDLERWFVEFINEPGDKYPRSVSRKDLQKPRLEDIW